MGNRQANLSRPARGRSRLASKQPGQWAVRRKGRSGSGVGHARIESGQAGRRRKAGMRTGNVRSGKSQTGRGRLRKAQIGKGRIRKGSALLRSRWTGTRKAPMTKTEFNRLYDRGFDAGYDQGYGDGFREGFEDGLEYQYMYGESDPG